MVPGVKQPSTRFVQPSVLNSVQYILIILSQAVSSIHMVVVVNIVPTLTMVVPILPITMMQTHSIGNGTVQFLEDDVDNFVHALGWPKACYNFGH